MSTLSASRSLFAWSLSSIESGLTEILSSGERGIIIWHFAPRKPWLRTTPQVEFVVGSLAGKSSFASNIRLRDEGVKSGLTE